MNLGNKLSYADKEVIMDALFAKYESKGGFRSKYKAVPMTMYEQVKDFIDFTKYYVCFRGPRTSNAYSTLKRDAYAFDVYRRDPLHVNRIRIEREAFLRGVAYGQSYDRMIKTI